MGSVEYPPLATLVVLFYKHEQFVEDTVAGALSQTYPNLEIIFSDDNSPDGTFEVLEKAVRDYHGPHRIILNRNEKNLGLVPHVNKLLFELSHGEFIFLNGGDDISLPERVALGVEYFQSDPSVTAVSGSYITIDKDGKETGNGIFDRDTLLRVDDRKYLKSDSFMTGGVALSFRRTVLEKFGRLGGRSKQRIVQFVYFGDMDRFDEYINTKYGQKALEDLYGKTGNITLDMCFELKISNFRGNDSVDYMLKNYR